MTGENGSSLQSNKRRRLNHACERCRGKKTRCDDRYPACTNCYKAGVDCVTRDPRNPTAIIVRHEAQLAPASYHAIEDVYVAVSEDTPVSVSSLGSSVRRNPPAKEVEDAIQPPGQGRATARLPVFPRFMNGNSLYILTQWLDLAFARLNHSSRFSHLYKEATPRSTQPTLQDKDVDEILNVLEQRQSILDNFLNTIHLVFRLETTDRWYKILTEARASSPMCAILRALILALSDHTDARRCLDLAFSRISVIIQHSNVESLVALFLMIIAFRGFNDSHTAVHLLSIANSINHGLHTTLPRSNSLHINVWWSLYAIDKALAVELERKPLILLDDSIQPVPADDETLVAIVQLARVQETIVDRVVREREMEDSRDRTLDEIITHKMRSAGELDELLLRWEAGLSSHMRISDNPCADANGLPGMVYLALQYHQSLFAIHRNSLITNAGHIRNLADEAFSDKQYRLRLRNGSLICYSTAKSIITLVSHIFDQGQQSSLDTTHTLLTAAIGLAIYVYKHPNTSVVYSDLQLLLTAIEFIERRALASREMSQDQNLGILLRLLHADLTARVRSYGEESTPIRGQQSDGIHGLTKNNMLTADTARTTHGNEERLGYGVTQNFERSEIIDLDANLFTDDMSNWPDFLELLDLSGPMASFSRNPI